MLIATNYLTGTWWVVYAGQAEKELLKDEVAMEIRKVAPQPPPVKIHLTLSLEEAVRLRRFLVANYSSADYTFFAEPRLVCGLPDSVADLIRALESVGA